MLDEIIKVFKLTGLLDALKGYIETRIKLYIADIENRVAHVLAGVIMLVAFMITLFIVIIFVGVGISMLLNRWLESHYLGFLIVGGAFFIPMLIAAANISTGYFHRKIKSVIQGLLQDRK